MSIAIWGLGISGKSTLNYLLKNYDGELHLINQGEPSTWGIDLNFDRNVHLYEQSKIPDGIHFDKIIMAAGVDPRIPELIPFKDVPKICNEELVFDLVKTPIIAVTGTNGKTTTVTLISQALEMAGYKVFLGGNIGTPLTEMLLNGQKYDYCVLELSSFQLELMDKFRANIAVILNISKSHMERYDHFEDYCQAKFNIVNNQELNDLYLAPGEFLKLETKATKKAISEVLGYEFNNPALIGKHHQRNFKVVDDILSYLSIKDSHTIVQKLINSFTGVKYRLEFLGNKNTNVFYNDAKSTNTDATVNAVSAFDKDIILIMGGKLRDETQDLKISFSKLTNIKKIYAVGDAKDYIEQELAENFNIIKSENLSDVFSELESLENEIILFSPAFPSFDQYKNYIERGKDFERNFNLL